jgi:hypothetical protein
MARERHMFKYDVLVYLGLIPIVAAIMFAGFVIRATPAEADIELRKIRIADAMLVGLLAFFTFITILYFVDATGAGKDIFDKVFAPLFALLGTVTGYLFGAIKK